MNDDWPETDPGAPLAGLHVLDLSEQLPGPYATALLADLGAAVLKIERPGGDVGRRIDPDMYRQLNGRKQVVELDLKSVPGRERMHAIARAADVVMVSWRPGVAERLAADPGTLAALNPRLLYCSLTGYGHDGPLARRGAHDLNIQAAAGAVASDGQTDRIGVAWVDLAAGQSAALAISANWHARRAGFIDVAMLDIARSWALIKPDAILTREPAYGTVSTRDGGRFVITVLEDDVWLRLCRAFGWSDWAADTALASSAGRRNAVDLVQRRLREAVASIDGPAFRSLADRFDLFVTAIDPVDPDVTEQRAVRERAVRLPHVAEPVPWPLIFESPAETEASAARRAR